MRRNATGKEIGTAAPTPRATSFAAKLSRLPNRSRELPPETLADGGALARRSELGNGLRASAPGTTIYREGTVASPPTLEQLRDRIAQIVGQGRRPSPKADPTAGELPFQTCQTPQGVLHTRRVACLPGARVGRCPLHDASTADATMLALFALDPKLQQCDPKGALYIDTETTGLAGGAGTVPFLIGLSYWHEGRWVFEQLLLRRLGQEAPMLEVLRQRIAEASMLVSYNGKSFDLPLLRTRFVMNRMAAPTEPPHLDLLHVARRLHGKRLPANNLTSVEAWVLGMKRIGDIAGADVVAMYSHFLRTGDDAALLGVIDHNEMDVLSMVALVGLYGAPIGNLDPLDLAAAAHTIKRAGALERAAEFAEVAVELGGGLHARRIRGEISKARGDKTRAILEFEALSLELDDPSLRLELAKLYEHYLRCPAQALEHVERGTGEDDEAVQRRKTRLERKLCRKPNPRPRHPRARPDPNKQCA